MSSNKIKSFNQNRDLCFWSMIWGWIPSVWRAVLSLFYPPVIIWGKNGKNSENPVGSNKSEKRKPKSAVYRRILASVVYFHLRIISAKNHKRKMTRNQVVRKGTWVRIPPAPPKSLGNAMFPRLFLLLGQHLFWGKQFKWCPWCPAFWCPAHSTSCTLYKKDVCCGAPMVPGTAKKLWKAARSYKKILPL